MRSGAATIEPTVCRGFSDEYGSWKIICTSRRSGRIAPTDRCVMSRPSKTTFPPVGSSSRVTSRPVVDLPQPDSPTRPSVSPGRIAKSMPSTARTAPTFRWTIAPRLIGKCFSSPVTSSRLSVVGTGDSLQRGRDVGGEELASLGRRDVAGDAVHVTLGQVGHDGPARDPVAEGVWAARVERAAAGQVDQARRRPLDRDQPITYRTVGARHRAEQPPRVRVFGAAEQLVGGAVLDAHAAVHHQ